MVYKAGSPAYLLRLGPAGQPEERYVLIGSGPWSVGRSDQSAIILGSPWVSRMHALIQRAGEQEFYVIDLGSRNGTFVNGQRVMAPVQLQDGDRVTFGQIHLQFTYQTDRPDTPDPFAPGVSDRTTSVMKTRCLMTVVVLNISNFKALVEQIPEPLVAQVVGTWFRLVGEILQRYGSQVDKYVEDAVMAVWFHPQNEPRPADWLRILRAIWGIQRTTSNLHLQYMLPFPLRLGTGINTGYAMVGHSGSGQRPEYVALGDTVSRAFQLDAATKTLGLDVLVGENTYDCLSKANLADWLTPTEVAFPYQPKLVTVWGSTYDHLRTFLYNHGAVETPTHRAHRDGRGFV
ncbi:MAG: adenylate/guanylate cyclase domain-containing protein [Gloeomargarita sp. SKYG116]|nr:adenylate/guanylate cyclase domain-containing protein [Gloeomargarita sp. SKYG116]MCS7226279.1 adenylate/guanylate cyclase domain-containing protein [Gloeomargarita sp. SKYB31]MDW8400584.1 adenylate/guanylate cyclase domain-containing protein [Gloeomargarita sp. SKYGB_i_bin116]